MSIYRINPELLKSNGASDGDVLTYVSTNGKIEWKASSSDEANLYNTYTTLTANDYSTYTTLSGLINTVQDNVSSQTSNTQIYLGDSLFSNTAIILEAGDGISLTGNTTAQTITLSTSMSNITSQVITSDGSANSFTLVKEVANSNMIFVSYNGLLQDPLLYEITTTSGVSTLTLANTDPLASGDRIEVRYVDLFQFAGTTSSGGGGDYSFQGSTSGYTSGGSFPSTFSNVIDKFPFASDSNATDVGDLTQAREIPAGQSSTSSGYNSGGAPGAIDTIDKFPFSADANATDVGNLTQGRRGGAGQSSAESGYTSSGFAPAVSNTIDKFPFSADANATDVGDLTQGRYASAAGQSSTESGYTSGGFTTATVDTIDKFSFSVDGNATDVGDLTQARYLATGQSSTTSGYTSGGFTTATVDTIDKFPFSADANATDVGDLSQTRMYGAGQSSTESGYTSGGATPSRQNTIDKFSFSTDTNATDVGDLTQFIRGGAGQQV